jgi:hypothetical protein
MGAGVRVLFRYGVLHVDGTLHGIDGAGEVRDKAVTSRAKDPTAMRGDQAVDNGPILGQGAKGADLIEPHQSAVAFDIGCEDRGELPFDPRGFQGSSPPRSSIARPDARSAVCKPF